MDKGKAAVHHMIATNSLLRDQVETEASAVPMLPDDPTLRMAFNEGRRSYAAELMSIYREVEDEINGRHTT